MEVAGAACKGLRLFFRSLTVNGKPVVRRSFYYRFTWNGKQQRVKLGDHPALSLGEARRTVEEAPAGSSGGQVPKRMEQQRAPEELRYTIKDRMESWLTEVSFTDDRQRYVAESCILPALSSRIAAELTRGDLVSWLLPIEMTYPLACLLARLLR